MKTIEMIKYLQENYEPEAEVAFSIWIIDDVKAVCPSLTDEEAVAVIRKFHNFSDASQGLNWSVLTSVIEEMYPDRQTFEPGECEPPDVDDYVEEGETFRY